MTGAFYAGDLDIRSGREVRVAFEQRPNPLDFGRIAFDDRVGVPDGDRHELDPFELLGRPDFDPPQFLLDQLAARPSAGHPLADSDSHLLCAAPV